MSVVQSRQKDQRQVDRLIKYSVKAFAKDGYPLCIVLYDLFSVGKSSLLSLLIRRKQKLDVLILLEENRSR